MTQLDVKLKPVTVAEKNILTNLMQFYCYDSAVFNGDAFDAAGKFAVSQYFDAYWLEPERHPFFIKQTDKLVGFALVRQLSRSTYSVAEFFIARQYRRRGTGARAATGLFNLFAGEWHVAQAAGNVTAQRFWRKVIADYTKGDYLEAFSETQPRGPKQIFRTRTE